MEAYARWQSFFELINLEYLELGDNRIAKIEGLDANRGLRRLYLGANGISRIENLEMLVDLEVLSLPANALWHIEVRFKNGVFFEFPRVCRS